MPLKKWCAENHYRWDSEKCGMAYALGHHEDQFDFVGEASNLTLKKDCGLKFYGDASDPKLNFLPE